MSDQYDYQQYGVSTAAPKYDKLNPAKNCWRAIASAQ